MLYVPLSLIFFMSSERITVAVWHHYVLIDMIILYIIIPVEFLETNIVFSSIGQINNKEERQFSVVNFMTDLFLRPFVVSLMIIYILPSDYKLIIIPFHWYLYIFSIIFLGCYFLIICIFKPKQLFWKIIFVLLLCFYPFIYKR